MASKNSGNEFLKLGYIAGIILAFVCIISAAVYLFVFQLSSPNPETLKNEFQLLSITAERRLLLLSTAMFIAMSFGFLGFALFLIQAKGDVDAEGSYGDYKVKFARLSPGLFVILCSTIIIIFSATFRIDYGLSRKSSPNTKQETTRDQSQTLDDESAPDPSDEQLVGNDSSALKARKETNNKDSTKRP